MIVAVLDEADRILDMGFAQAMNAIVENLPSERQTLLFSATQTKYVMNKLYFIIQCGINLLCDDTLDYVMTLGLCDDTWIM